MRKSGLIAIVFGVLWMVYCGPPPVTNCPEGTQCTDSGNPDQQTSPDGTKPGDTPVKPSAVQWNPTPSGVQVDLWGVAMIGDQKAWAVGDNGTILHSTDAGATWKAQTSGVTTSLRGIFFLDEKQGWVVGGSGTILRTKDGGTKWDKLTSPVTEQLRKVQFVTKDIGFAIGDGFSLLRTSNGGDSWNPTSFTIPIDLFGLYFHTTTKGYVVGSEGTILLTEDGAKNVTTEATGTDRKFWDVHFIDADEGWAIGEEGKVLHIDKTSNWQPQDVGVDVTLYGISFGSKTRGWMVGKNGLILGTRDQGKNWNSETRAPDPNLYAVKAAAETSGVAVGQKGTILRLHNVAGECTAGAKQDCYTGPDGTKDVGRCKAGTQTCVDGVWGACTGEIKPADAEICFNDQDDDCNGKPDSQEKCPDCQDGDKRECYTGPDKTKGVGSCKPGEQFCVASAWGTCESQVEPSEEQCNGQDDDCDGQVDNDPKNPPPCDLAIGVCAAGRKICQDGKWQPCTAAQYGADYQEKEDKCDDKDNDCDGVIDEGCPCTQDGQTRDCYGGAADTKGKGDCKGGTQTCKSGTWTECEGEVKPTQEICNDQKDNDCDGLVDEKTQYAPLFNGSHIAVKAASALEPANEITVEGWFFFTTISGFNAHSLVSKGEMSGYALQVNRPRAGQLSFRVWGPGARDYTSATASTRNLLKTGQWYHIAGTYDGATLRLWVDGKKVAETAYNRAISYSVSGVPLIIGAEASRTGVDSRNSWFFSGQVAQVRVSNKAVYNADFTPSCMLPKETDTVGLWLLNEGSGNTANDETGNHPGQFSNANWREAIRCPGYSLGGCKPATP